MHWYYVKNGEKTGPIADRDLQGFVEKGDVTDDTLVWNETMKDWAPYGEIPSTLGASLAQAAIVKGPTCSMCGNEFPQDQLIGFEGSNVCAGCKPDFIQQIKENAEIASDAILRYAGFWRRLGAWIIDYIIMYISWIVLAALMGFIAALYADDSVVSETASAIMLILIYIIMLTVPVLYVSLMHGKYGATLGKKALGIKVVLSTGEPITYGRATGRCFATALSYCTFYIGFIIAGFDSQKRALQDHICNTRVIKVR